MSKKQIFNKIKSRTFQQGTESILNILEANLDRVTFVKDHLGLQDILYIAEDNVDEYEYQIFASFNIQVQAADPHDVNASFFERTVIDLEDINKQITSFFSNTSRTLYVEIGFQESVLDNDDMFRIVALMNENKAKDPNDAITQLRQFPEWYDAKYPEQIIRDSASLEILYHIQQTKAESYKRDIMSDIEATLLDNSEDLFNELAEKYSNLSANLP